MMLLLAATIATAAPANWTFENLDDPIMQTKSQMVWGGDMNSGAIVVRCKSDRLSILVTSNNYIGTDEASVVYRFEKDNEPTYGVWDLSTSGQVAFVPDNQESGFVQRLKDDSIVHVSIRNYRDVPSTFSVSLIGAASKLNKLSCL